MGYKNLRDPQSAPQIQEYMALVANKYMTAISSNDKDVYLDVAKKSFDELNRVM